MGGENRLEELSYMAGLIPAWAGKTEGWEAGGGAIRAHPRVGGENWRAPAL